MVARLLLSPLKFSLRPAFMKLAEQFTPSVPMMSAAIGVSALATARFPYKAIAINLAASLIHIPIQEYSPETSPIKVRAVSMIGCSLFGAILDPRNHWLSLYGAFTGLGGKDLYVFIPNRKFLRIFFAFQMISKSCIGVFPL